MTADNGTEDDVLLQMIIKYQQPSTEKTMSVSEAYQRLGVYPEDHPREIVSAYRRECNKWHPDKWANKSAEEQANAAGEYERVQTAYRTIMESRGLTD